MKTKQAEPYITGEAIQLRSLSDVASISAWHARFKGHRRASSIIEMAFVLPLLLFVVMGMAEFGQYFYIRNAFQAAARDVARASCLSNAQQLDPVNKATATLGQANVTFDPRWMTIVDVSNSNATVSDVSAVGVGHQLLVTIQTQYNLIPNAYRPLYTMTGKGIGNGKMCSGQSTMIKE